MSKISEWVSDQTISPAAESLHELYLLAAQHYPQHRAIACLHQSANYLAGLSGCTATDGPYLRWTHKELVQASHALARQLYHAGLRSGMRIVSFITSGIEWHLLLRACLELKCVYCPLNPNVANNEREANHMFSIIKPSVIVVQRIEIAGKLEQFATNAVKDATLRLVLDVGSDKSGKNEWQVFENFAEEEETRETSSPFEDATFEHLPDDVIMLFSTSGTTSMPKGCPVTNRNFTAASTSNKMINGMSEKRVACNHLPLNHIMANNYIHQLHISGGCVVHPAATFDAASSLRAIREEGCTDVPGVPAVLQALLAHPSFKKSDMKTVQIIRLGATKILSEDIKACFDGFGAQNVGNGFGMTESSMTFQRVFIPDSNKPKAKLHPGLAVRVCDPDNGKPLALGEHGELHVGGPIVIKKYWLAPEQEVDNPFYDDDFGHWMKTGDQAVMSEDGDIAIVGRYKDLIIRGGENVAPTAIEATLQSDFDLSAEVVGVPDAIAGEVPVAVVEANPEQAEKLPQAEIKERLIQKYGQASAIEAIIPVQDLGLDKFPKTNTGKVQKNVLRDRLAEHMQTKQQTNGKTSGQASESKDTLQALLALWTRLLGVGEGTLTAETIITEWADSLLIARFPGLLEKELSLSMNLQEIAENSKISEQAQLLDSRSSRASGYDDLFTQREGPPETEDMSFARDRSHLEQIRAACDDMLSSKNLSWDDVEDITPMYGFQKCFLQRRRPQSNNHRHAFVCDGDIATTKAALQSALGNNAMLRTMAIRVDKEPYHVALRPSEAWFAHCITELDPIDSPTELKRLKWNDENFDFAAFPGPMFRILLAPVKGSNQTGLIYMAQHSAFDGISLPFFQNDLNAMLSGDSAESLPKRVPFKAWVDSTYALESSSTAQASIRWQVQRLLDAGIGNGRAALFPLQRAPDWFKGDSTGWIDESTGKPGPARQSLDQDGDGVTGLSQKCSFPGLAVLKKEHGIDPSQTLKAALAILNCRHTKQPVALFAQYQAARDWPFLQPWQAARMPPAMEVNGPTVQTIINAIRIDKATSVLDLLKHTHDEQQSLNKHAAAPFGEVIEGLKQYSVDAGDVMVQAWRRQIFNWLPGSSSNNLECMTKVQQVSRTDVGLLWNCKAAGSESVQIMPSWDDAQLSRAEVEELLSEYIRIIEQLVDQKNWSEKLEKLFD